MTVGSLVGWLVVAIALAFATYLVIVWNAARLREPAHRRENLKTLGRAAFALAVACFAATMPLEGEATEVALLVLALGFVAVDIWLSSRARKTP